MELQAGTSDCQGLLRVLVTSPLTLVSVVQDYSASCWEGQSYTRDTEFCFVDITHCVIPLCLSMCECLTCCPSQDTE